MRVPSSAGPRYALVASVTLAGLLLSPFAGLYSSGPSGFGDAVLRRPAMCILLVDAGSAIAATDHLHRHSSDVAPPVHWWHRCYIPVATSHPYAPENRLSPPQRVACAWGESPQCQYTQPSGAGSGCCQIAL